MVERARATVSSFLPNWIARYLNDGIVIALLLDPSDHRLRLRDTEVVKINLWRWRQQLSIRHLRLSPATDLAPRSRARDGW